MKGSALVTGFSLIASLVATHAIDGGESPKPVAFEVVENRTVRLMQTVTLHDIPAGAKHVEMWAPIPSDGMWQRVLDREVVSAPGAWKLVTQDQGRGDFVHVQIDSPPAGDASVVIACTVQRQGVHFSIENAALEDRAIQNEMFADTLDQASPLMEVDQRIRAMADETCGDERDPAKQALLLMQRVAKEADHYSKDPTKPTCGRGAAEDCLEHGGGCCTDLHSLFIAMARARGIPARMQYGYRTLDAKAGTEFDPGYRCWVEFFVPGAGWIPTDIVAADNAESLAERRWASLSATRVWLWEGRSFELTPRAHAGPIHTMTCGWAEIDGKAIDVLPAADGTPSRLRRTVKFEVVSADRGEDIGGNASVPVLPQ